MGWLQGVLDNRSQVSPDYVQFYGFRQLGRERCNRLFARRQCTSPAARATMVLADIPAEMRPAWPTG